ncbi:Spo0E family sporulation regulatory protein-aspartic acid phosphatase [Peribacillus sp. FSL H8-0477]|uniref:Spo0E family sporulation regulatory protein-aspartic acid phosphatase n=1 Tax=Peribacillus sp. FSL H8-0477 TaxID=2921388 RepID=UPI0040469093
MGKSGEKMLFLTQLIERTRIEMIKKANKNGCNCVETIELSRQLDHFILIYQTLALNNHKLKRQNLMIDIIKPPTRAE